MNRKYIFSFLFALFALPVMAQANLDKKVEQTVLRAQAQTQMEEELPDPYILTRAEELLQKDRNDHSGNAVHDFNYYYNQVREQEGIPAQPVSKPQPQPQEVAPTTQPVLFQDPSILIRAEELLQKDRNAHNGNATHTLDYYYQQVINE